MEGEESLKGTGTNSECIILVLLEMGLSFCGIVSNLLIVTTLRQEESLRASTLNFLLFNLCFSNLVISFLVKPISAIYIGYAVSTGESQVGLAFCTLYTFTYRTTWCVFPFTLIAMCWAKLISQCRCTRCGILCCKKRKTLAKFSAFQSANAVPLTTVTEVAPQPVTELLQFRANRLLATSNSLQRDSSVSTPTPSTTPEGSSKPTDNGGAQTLELLETQRPGNAPSRVTRTLSDGPTARQRMLVISIWIVAAIFGFLTCFPDKMMGSKVEVVPTSTIPVLSTKPVVKFRATPTPSMIMTSTPINEKHKGKGEDGVDGAVIPDFELSYCSVKNGVNDLLDYIALVVALVAPLIIGPCIVGIFQGIFAVFGRFVCSNGQADYGGLEKDEKKGPGWPIIIAFTIVFLATYPLHMYFAELYLDNDFNFLLAKYCMGFLYVIFIPVITLIAQKEIRGGVGMIITKKSSNTGVVMVDMFDEPPN